MSTEVASQADVLGFDFRVSTDLDPSGRSATGLELVLDGMLHRLQEDTLLMTGAPDDQIEFGVNVRRWIGGALDQSTLEARGPLIEEVLRRDPRIASITLSLSMTTGDDASRFNFFIRIHAVTIRGQTIDRIVGVSSVSVEFLAQGR